MWRLLRCVEWGHVRGPRQYPCRWRHRRCRHPRRGRMATARRRDCIVDRRPTARSRTRISILAGGCAGRKPVRPPGPGAPRLGDDFFDNGVLHDIGRSWGQANLWAKSCPTELPFIRLRSAAPCRAREMSSVELPALRAENHRETLLRKAERCRQRKPARSVSETQTLKAGPPIVDWPLMRLRIHRGSRLMGSGFGYLIGAMCRLYIRLRGLASTISTHPMFCEGALSVEGPQGRANLRVFQLGIEQCDGSSATHSC